MTSSRDLKDKTYKLYKSTNSVWSKAIKQNVIFNRYGLIHLSFTSGGHRRSKKDRNLRLTLFPHAREVIRKAKVIIKESEGTITSKRGIQRKAKYFEIASKCDKGKRHITVILRRIEKGNLHFYSLRRTSPKTIKALKKSELV